MAWHKEFLMCSQKIRIPSLLSLLRCWLPRRPTRRSTIRNIMSDFVKVTTVSFTQLLTSLTQRILYFGSAIVLHSNSIWHTSTVLMSPFFSFLCCFMTCTFDWRSYGACCKNSLKAKWLMAGEMVKTCMYWYIMYHYVHVGHNATCEHGTIRRPCLQT